MAMLAIVEFVCEEQRSIARIFDGSNSHALADIEG